MLTSTAHALLVPMVYCTPFGYIFYGQNFMAREEVWGTYGGHIFVVFFYLTFLVLSFHFLYRALVTSGCEVLSRSCKWKTAVVVSISTIVYSAGWAAVVQLGFLPTPQKREMYRAHILNETGIDLLAAPKPGFLAIIFRVPDDQHNLTWQLNACLSIGLALFIFLTTAFVIIICCIKIFRDLQNVASKSSVGNRRFQRQLLFALLAQTAVPLLLSYIPLGVVFIFPICGWHLGGLTGDLLMMTTAIFPLFDPILIILFVGKYRWHALLELASLLRQQHRVNEWRERCWRMQQAKK